MTAPEAMQAALARVQREFPDARLTEVRLEHRLGERHDHGPSQTWSETFWTVQVENESAHDDSLDAALGKLRGQIARKAQIPERAERIAAILREVPDESFDRYRVLEAAQRLVEKAR